MVIIYKMPRRSNSLKSGHGSLKFNGRNWKSFRNPMMAVVPKGKLTAENEAFYGQSFANEGSSPRKTRKSTKYNTNYHSRADDVGSANISPINHWRTRQRKARQIQLAEQAANPGFFRRLGSAIKRKFTRRKPTGA